MRRFCFFLTSIFSFSVVVSGTAIAAPKWHMLQAPTENLAQSYGSYSAGCVDGAVRLPEAGEGYRHMRRKRGRFFGHPALVDFVTKLGVTAKEHKLGELLISDLSAPRGGHPAPTSNHRSHQNGLDVDVWYRRGKPGEVIGTGAAISAFSVVDKETEAVDAARWNKKNTDVLGLAASDSGVDRIFVHPAVKKELCTTVPEQWWLYKIRPWWGHDRHFHVRLKCPVGDAGCEPQAPIAKRNGCDDSLEWWFSEEAKEIAQQPAKPYVPPPLPAACDAVLRAADK